MLKEKTKNRIKSTQLYSRYLQLIQNIRYFSWLLLKKDKPIPHIVKQRIVKDYSKRFSMDTFVETGTFRGEMVFAMRRRFKRIFSIELDPVFYQQSKKKFSSMKHITILRGDSSHVLPEILKKINRPSLFWLDAHYSGGKTAQGEVDSPILYELEVILGHNIDNHVILIDDARCFIGKNGYPKLDKLRDIVLKSDLDLDLSVDEDIIRIFKKSNLDE